MEMKVSLIIPVYEVEDYLERAVDSALAQTLLEKEIILVDDGSSDGCPAICDRYAREYPGVVRVIHQENQGLGMARNAGVKIARGEYIGFMDSDDTVEPEMLQALYEKAKEGDFQLVMCDVRILFLEENREVVVSSYSREEVDLGDYIAHGNNITYSVNKLFHRSVWEENQYEKMLFEDIALIPALVTRCRRVGYVPRAFYNYYRRPNTLSTTQTGEMGDIVESYRRFLTDCDPVFREEAVYGAAKQLLWNMTQSRTLFLPDFIELLKQFEGDFRLNPYLKHDQQTGKILEFLDRKVIPENFICAHCRHPLPQALEQALEKEFPHSRKIHPGEGWMSRGDIPENVCRAGDLGHWRYVEEYLSLVALWEEGGIVLAPEAVPKLLLKRRRMEPVFFGFENPEEVSTLCFGATPRHYVIGALLDSYRQDHIYNRAFLPLSHRLRDLLITGFGLQMNGRRQVLGDEITVHLPSVLAYDLHDGENCCKRGGFSIPSEYEVVSGEVLEFWSARLMENWNLYKAEREKRLPDGQRSTPEPLQGGTYTQAQLEGERKRIAALYEESTSWKVTRPLRAIARLWKK